MTYITCKLNRYKKEATALQVRNRVIIDMKYVKFKLNRYKKEINNLNLITELRTFLETHHNI